MARELIDPRDLERRLSAGLGNNLPWAALSVAVALTCLAEALSRALDGELSTAAGLAVATAVGLLVGVRLTRPLFKRPAWLGTISTEDALPARWLVVAASPGRDGSPAGRAIQAQTGRKHLERVFVLYTKDEPGLRFYNQVHGEALAAGLTPTQIEPCPVPVAARWDPEQVVPALHQIYRDAVQAAVDDEEILIDYTGGSSSFTAAMTLVGARPGRRLAQICPDQLDDAGQPAPGSPWKQIEIELRLHPRR